MNKLMYNGVKLKVGDWIGFGCSIPGMDIFDTGAITKINFDKQKIYVKDGDFGWCIDKEYCDEISDDCWEKFKWI